MRNPAFFAVFESQFFLVFFQKSFFLFHKISYICACLIYSHKTMEDQIRLFEIVKSKIPNNLNLVDEIEDLLGLSKESAYRRVRGEKVLSFAEWKMICGKYQLSMDEIINAKSEKGALFQYNPVNISDIDSYIACLKRLRNFMDVVASSTDEKKLVFSALDIPFYHF